MTNAELQRALAALGLYNGTIDGVLGRQTTAAIVAFQQQHGLVADGLAGPVTRGVLQVALADRGAPELTTAPKLTVAMLTSLAATCGGRPNAAVVAGIVDYRQHLIAGGIDTPPRLAEFLAQACLETDYFRTLCEYWGPTAAQRRYEGRKDLGNTEPGDGKRFMGRGIFQLTGRANYRAYGCRLGLDLEAQPELAARPDVSVRAAALYWADKGLNAYADRGDTRAIARAINRGSATADKPANHEADRIRIAKIARTQLAA